MKRRTFLLTSAAVTAFAQAPLVAANKSSSILNVAARLDAVAEIKKLQITTGSFTGGYQIAPWGRLNWYFANLGLTALVPYLSAADLDVYVRRYLDLYLSRLETNYTIKDADFVGFDPYGKPTGNYKLTLSDSDDAYAATFLSLATRYIKASQNWVWWKNNKLKLKAVAYANLAVTVKPNGLSSVFQAPRSVTNNTAYLMDNCEVYRGLRDFAEMLRNTGDVDADYYDRFANGIARGIANYLYDTRLNAFLANDQLSNNPKVFYPDFTCQVYPQAYGLVELAYYFGYAWNYLNTSAPLWQTGRYNSFPWAILGFVAAQRGAIAQAQAQLQTVENLFSNANTRGYVTINELGFYLRAKSALAAQI